MTRGAYIDIDIATWWISATGRGRAAAHDASTVTDEDGLPLLPGRHLKGLVRAALTVAEGWGHVASGTTARLCGERNDRADAAACVSFGNGLMLPQQRAAVIGHPARREALFQDIAATAIDGETGTARDSSLRVLRVAVPLRLCAGLRWIGPGEPGNWMEPIAIALPLVRAVGAHRHRGMGRAVLTIGSEPSA